MKTKMQMHLMRNGQSMSKVGHCIDNEPTECFWSIIKAEMYQLYKITDEASLRHGINDYVRFYSTERRPK